jgi:hypothetical protein
MIDNLLPQSLPGVSKLRQGVEGNQTLRASEEKGVARAFAAPTGPRILEHELMRGLRVGNTRHGF